MSNQDPVFKVIVGANGVVLEKVKRKRPDYRKTKKRAIVRQRDAIELFRKLKTGGKRFDGTYAFRFLETARSFAMLRLQAKESELQDNLDRLLAYDGSTKRSSS